MTNRGFRNGLLVHDWADREFRGSYSGHRCFRESVKHKITVAITGSTDDTGRTSGTTRLGIAETTKLGTTGDWGIYSQER